MRQLTGILHEEEAGVIYSLLLSLHAELYIKKDGGEICSFAESAADLKDREVYVPEADYDICAETLRKEGYGSLVCTEQEEAPQTETEKIMNDFRKKRKWHMIEWAVVIGAVLLYQIIRSIM